MRKLSPAILAASVTLALASGAAFGQARITTTQGTTSPGSTSAGTTATSGTGTGAGASNSSFPSESAGSADIGAPTQRAAVPATQSNSQLRGASPPLPASQTNLANTTNPASVAANSPFRVTPNIPGATPTAAALGTSPGQTSAGTATAPSSSGVGVRGDSLGLTPQTNIAVPGSVVVPGGAVTGFGFTGGADAGAGVNANGERVGGGADLRGGAAVASNQVTPTPLFDMAAARGAAREQARRARGDEPRIIGIAPRTERDLTHQMPDDPIIRY